MADALPIVIHLPIKTISEANGREHWRAKSKRAADQRRTSKLLCHAALQVHRRELTPPLVITVIRIGPRKLDSDNLASSQKHVRDGLADALGIDDGSPLLDWRYAQERGKPKEYAVRIELHVTRGLLPDSASANHES